MNFLPYQTRWILDESPLKLYEKTRRAGITYATSYRCVRKCLRQSASSHFVQWVSSRDEVTAREFIVDYVAAWARSANRAAREIVSGLEGDFEVVDESRDLRGMTVRFRNGARIVSLSSNPLAFAGKGGDVLIDEMDLHEDQETLYAMAYPCITWGGQLEMVSAYNPAGSEYSVFARLCREARGSNPMHLSFHRTTLDDAIAEGFADKVNELKRANGRPELSADEFRASLRAGYISESAFATQYCCVPNRADGSALIPPAELAAALENYTVFRSDSRDEPAGPELADPAFWDAQFAGTPHIAVGFDTARTGDLASIWVNAVERRIHRAVAVITLKNCRFEQQKNIVRALLKARPRAVAAADKTGLGMAVCEDLADEFGERFEGVNFGASKMMLATLMRRFFEQRRIRLSLDAHELAADIAALRQEANANGRLVIAEGENPRLPDSHCDLAWSLALALYAGSRGENAGPCLFEPARTPESDFRRDADFFHPQLKPRSRHDLSPTPQNKWFA